MFSVYRGQIIETLLLSLYFFKTVIVFLKIRMIFYDEKGLADLLESEGTANGA